MKILITCGLRSEYNEARNQLSLTEITNGKSFPRVSQKKDIKLLWTGIGKVNTAISLMGIIKDYTPDLIIDSGTCGSLNNNTTIGDIIVSLESQEYFSYKTPGNIISNTNLNDINNLLDLKLSKINRVISIEDSVTEEDNKKLILKNGGNVVTWETSTVFKIAAQFGFKVVSIRGVTDMCNNNTFNDFKKNRIVVSKRVYNYINDVLKNVN